MRRRLKNEAVTSCKAMLVWMGRPWQSFTPVDLTSLVCDAMLGLDLDFRGAGSASRPIRYFSLDQSRGTCHDGTRGKAKGMHNY